MGERTGEGVELRDTKEKCGVFGARSAVGDDVVPLAVLGLEALQHRGQESWGVAAAGMPVLRRMGLVASSALQSELLSSYAGPAAIGHVRYSTKGRSAIENAQPIEIGTEFSIAHNGTIMNADELSESAESEFGRACESDTMAVGLRLLHYIKEVHD